MNQDRDDGYALTKRRHDLDVGLIHRRGQHAAQPIRPNHRQQRGTLAHGVRDALGRVVAYLRRRDILHDRPPAEERPQPVGDTPADGGGIVGAVGDVYLTHG
jgi:hypothetical protein